MKYGKRVLMYGIPKSLLFKIILFLLILLVGKNVFAQDFNVDNANITSPSAGGRTGTYTGTEIYNSGTANVYNIGTRYNGQLSRIVFNLSSGGYADPSGFEKGHIYTLTMNMATDDWRNKFGSVSVKCDGSSGAELSNGRVTYVSYKKIKFSFTAPADRFCSFVYVDLRSTNINSVAFTGVSNWNLSSMVISDPAYSSGGGSSGGGSSGTGDSSNTDIINNANQNTQNVINNANQNTQDIIENNNNNTQEIKDSINDNLNSCTPSPNLFNINGSVNSYAVETPNGLNSVSNNVLTSNINGFNSYAGGQRFTNLQGKTFTFSARVISNGTGQGGYLTIADNNVQVRVSTFTAGTTGSITYTATSNDIVVGFATVGGTGAQFTDIQVNEGSSILSYEPYGDRCKNKLDEQTDAINNLNDTINNDNVDSGTGSDFFNDFSSQDNGGISGIITKPLVLINSLLTSNNSCNNLPLSITFPGLQEKQVSFPSGCILWNNVPQNVVSIYHIFIVGFCSYYLLKRLFKDVEDLKNPEKDNVEVIDL